MAQMDRIQPHVSMNDDLDRGRMGETRIIGCGPAIDQRPYLGGAG